MGIPEDRAEAHMTLTVPEAEVGMPGGLTGANRGKAPGALRLETRLQQCPAESACWGEAPSPGNQ